ncbi:hypothetical protein ALON55S_01526 [Alishewanella longhuensis]
MKAFQREFIEFALSRQVLKVWQLYVKVWPYQPVFF